VIGEGVVAKGMPAWEGKLAKTQLVLLSSYVARLRRNPVPGGKAPQGDLIEPWPAAPAAAPGDAAADAPEDTPGT